MVKIINIGEETIEMKFTDIMKVMDFLDETVDGAKRGDKCSLESLMALRSHFKGVLEGGETDKESEKYVIEIIDCLADIISSAESSIKDDNKEYSVTQELKDNNICKCSDGYGCLTETREDTLKFVKLRDGATIPSKAQGDAGLDIYPCFEEDYKVIKPNETVLIPTGLASIIPEGYYIQIQERGSTGSKGIKYSAGVIDSSYRGEWFLAVTNTNNIPAIISKFNLDNLPALKKMIDEACIVYPYDKALFQGVVHKVEDIKVKETDAIELKNCPTNRGDGKLGSSNK